MSIVAVDHRHGQGVESAWYDDRMTLTLAGFIISLLLELCFYRLRRHDDKRVLACGIIVLIAGCSASFIVLSLSFATVYIGLLSCYRIFNLCRILSNHREFSYLGHVMRRTSTWLICFQVFVGCIVELSRRLVIHSQTWLLIAAMLSLIGNLIITLTIQRHIASTREQPNSFQVADRDLPTLSVLIPARNETSDLTECLNSLLGSNYPKLEIIVLDDCSQNRHTPEIIRGYAHEGVQFLAGGPPSSEWLAKNYAYEQLASAANGELLLFCGVDARFSADSLRVLVETMLRTQRAMISILPINRSSQHNSLQALIWQPIRYAWELALPRCLRHHPPVLSTAWVIRAAALKEVGSFKAFARSVTPERHFARQLEGKPSGYSFRQSGSLLRIESAKSYEAQRATALRTRYPQLHRRLELTVFSTSLELLVFIAPLALCIIGVTSHQGILIALSAISILLSSYFYFSIVYVTYRRGIGVAAVLYPVAALIDVATLHYSMWCYEFGEVIWKGRNICIPVMHVIPRLPPI